MFLKRLEIFGFKSFADRTSIDFTPGVTALLGPNGCGKSNVVDSIKWVLGEQSIKNMRAEKMEDVIFNGTEGRKALNVAEVNLVIGNEEGFLDLDLSELSIKRRLYRSGESEYYINNTPVRLKEIRQIFFDTGIGKSAYSIMEQGRIDQLLSTKPEERRLVFEEAAGITKYKVKKSEAERKLLRTEQNMENIENILSEVRKQYETLKIQSDRTKRYRQMQDELFILDKNLSLLKLRNLKEKEDKKKNNLDKIEADKVELEKKIENIKVLIQEGMDKINEMEAAFNDNQRKIYGMEIEKDNRDNQTKLLQERLLESKEIDSALTQNLSNAEEKMSSLEKEKKEKDQGYIELSKRLKDFEKNIEDFEKNIERTDEEIKNNLKEITDLEKDIEEKDNKLNEKEIDLRAITDDIVKELDKGLKETESTFKERENIISSFQELVNNIQIKNEGKTRLLEDSSKIKDIKSDDYQKLLGNLKAHLNDMGQSFGSLEKLFGEYRKMQPKFLDTFIAPEGFVTQKRNLDNLINGLQKDIRNNRERISGLNHTNVELTRKIEEYRQLLSDLKVNRAEAVTQLSALKDSMGKLDIDIFDQKELLGNLNERLRANREKAKDLELRMEAIKAEKQGIDEERENLVKEMKKLDSSIKDMNMEISGERKNLDKSREDVNSMDLNIKKIQLDQESLAEQIETLERDFQEKYAKSLFEFVAETEEIQQSTQEIRTKFQDTRQEAKKLEHGLNFMAPEEFVEVKERYDFLNSQLMDLGKAKDDLERVTIAIQDETETLFMESYEQIKKNFHAMFRKLFGGGRADIQLVDPKECLNTGIEIYAQPPGKKLENISLLSGGEKSLTGIALLFAIYLVKPSPFCILDEIDAALDEANIQRFVDVLSDFSNRSQFIIITHNKKTVTGAATLLGVTMQESGISTLLSMRIAGDDE